MGNRIEAHNTCDLCEGLLEGFDACTTQRVLLGPMVLLWPHSLQIHLNHQIIFAIVGPQLLLVVFPIVSPLDLGLSERVIVHMAAEIGEGAHLGVDKGVSED